MRVAILATCHNRASTTLRGIESLFIAFQALNNVSFEIFVVDDGSTDGTADAILHAFPSVNVEVGSGDLFWNGGMRLAFQAAQKKGSFDAYLLFNDDVVLSPSGVLCFFEEFIGLNRRLPAVLVGATLEPNGGVSYSGFLRRSLARPLWLEKVVSLGSLQQCDTFNGNFVLVPGLFFEQIGGLDAAYVHSYGDIDLGYVAGGWGLSVYIASNAVGVCASNDHAGGEGRRFRRLSRVLCGTWGKADSLAQRLHFLRKHSPWAARMFIVPVTTARFFMHRLLSAF